VVKIQVSTFKVVSRKKLSDYPLSGLIRWKGLWVAGTTDGKLFFMRDKGMKVMNTFDMGSVHSALIANMHVEEGRLIMASARNRLYVFE
jgi:hypothetical protein